MSIDLGRHLLQTTLSTLGVVLAVAVTLAILAVNQGARSEAARQAERLGAATVVVRGAAATNTPAGAQVRYPLTVKDAEALAALIPTIAAVSPAAYSTMSVRGPVTTQMVEVTGVTADFNQIHRGLIARGRLLHAADIDTGARVAVLGGSLARRLYGYREPVGEPVRLGRDWYRVVGVLADAGQDIFVPLPALSGRQTTLDPAQRVAALWIRTRRSDRVDEAAAAIRAVLARAHPIAAEYEVVVARELLETRDRTQRMFSVIAAISAGLLFLLGGVAIANVMLAAVLERTPEIGLRRAVGATRRDIARQFLTEAAAISICGGAVGVCAGAALSRLTTIYTGWATDLSTGPVLLVLAVAVLLGLVAGAYPAVKAARIQPIDALMHE